MKGLFAILMAYWLWAIVIGAPLVLTGCFSAGGRLYVGYEVQDEIKTTAITHPNQMSITDRLWKWATTTTNDDKGDQA